MTGSPFAPVLAAPAAILPAAIREQYLLSAGAPYCIVLDGAMERIWHRPAWLWPFLWLLAHLDILFPETGRDVPATMIVAAKHDPDGAARQTWRRTFRFRTPRYFNATMAYDRRLDRVVEWLAPGNLLQIVWDVHFRAPAAVEIVTERIELRLGRLPKCACFPLDGGPRICIGSSLSMMEAVLLLATVGRRFHLAGLPGYSVAPGFAPTLRPEHGLPMVLHRREAA